MLEVYLASLLRSGAFLRLFVALLGSGAWGDEARLSISGYDPVAYFTDGKPVPGKTEFEYVWRDARWRFASAAHRDLFIKDPDHYAPQYDGYCAMGVADAVVFGPHKDTIDPEAWAIVDGKLYLTHTTRVLGRDGGNNEDFVLVGLRRRGKSAGVQDAIEGGVEATVEAIK